MYYGFGEGVRRECSLTSSSLMMMGWSDETLEMFSRLKYSPLMSSSTEYK